MDNEKVSGSVLLDRPIPLELHLLAGWKEIPVRENNEPLVPLGPFSDNDEVFTHAIYFAEKKDSPYPASSLEGSLITMFVRQDVAQRLKKAQSLLPKGMHLIALDTYRKLEVQQSLYDVYSNGLKELHPDLSTEQIAAETQKFVSVPSTNPDRPSPHNTGGAVDLAIFKLSDEIETRVQNINQEISRLGDNEWAKVYRLEMRKIGLIEQNMQPLDFGTRFDHAGERAALNYYEKLAQERPLTEGDQKIRDNRRLLYNVMREVGFQPYQDEWWHYNSPKSQMGAKSAGLNYAEYGSIDLSSENEKFEMMRRQHWLGSTRIFNNDIGPKFGIYPFSPVMLAAKAGVRESGDLRNTNWPTAEIIKPTEKAA